MTPNELITLVIFVLAYLTLLALERASQAQKVAKDTRGVVLEILNAVSASLLVQEDDVLRQQIERLSDRVPGAAIHLSRHAPTRGRQ
jgi:hypothetical protein